VKIKATQGRRRPLKSQIPLMLMFLPGLVLILTFEYGPMYGLVLAFKDFKLGLGVWDSPWVGMANFERLFNEDQSVRVLRNTIIISVLKLAAGIPAPIILALIINEVRQGIFKRSVQTISYLPHFLSWVILSSMIYQLLSPSSGIVNTVLKTLGFQPIYFLADPDWFRPILVISSLWKEVGWGTIIYLAALASVNYDLHEAAALDGASRLQRIRDINFPTIVPVIGIVALLNLGGVLNAGFDQVFNLYNPQVYSVGDIIDTFVYRVGLVGMDYGFATAVGLFKGVVGFTLVMILNAWARKLSDGRYGLW
jgi:putative aldouronate transport system permease protein